MTIKTSQQKIGKFTISYMDGNQVEIFNPEINQSVIIPESILRTILDTLKANQRAENLSKESASGNGEIVKNKKEEKV